MTEQEQAYGTSNRTKYLLIGAIVVLAFAISYGVASASSNADAAQQVGAVETGQDEDEKHDRGGDLLRSGPVLVVAAGDIGGGHRVAQECIEGNPGGHAGHRDGDEVHGEEPFAELAPQHEQAGNVGGRSRQQKHHRSSGAHTAGDQAGSDRRGVTV